LHLKNLTFTGFKRFTDFKVDGIPETARLIVLGGPNGSGKSSVFDGLKTWHWAHGGQGHAWDETYGTKVGSQPVAWSQHVSVEFHEPIPTGQDERKRLVYVRSAFRNEADFNIGGITRLASPLDQPKVQRLIDTDVSVSDNYQRLILQTLDGIYSDDLPADMTRLQLRDRIIGRVRDALGQVFQDLQLEGVGGVTVGSDSVGTFYFSKGTARRFLYKYLSAGEKACFDLILDAVVKSEYFDNSIWCIDEPETHLNTRIQNTLLATIFDLVPANSQLVIASHSIGFMRKAWEIEKATPGLVAFIDMHGHDFDSPVSLKPVKPSRELWTRTLDVALGDLAQLMAPERIVLCEGRPNRGAGDARAEFDANCYRTIFASEFPETDFMSVGSSSEVSQDRLETGKTIQTIASGTSVVRLIDRDLRNEGEVAQLLEGGVRVLSRRHIEAFLMDDEVIDALCEHVGEAARAGEIKNIRDGAIAASVQRGNDPDDWKSAAGEFFIGTRRALTLTSSGSNWHAFATETLAPLLQPGMRVYDDLKQDIFGRRP
jgi:hypothetical protein